MKTFIINQRSPLPAILAAALASSLVVSAFWFYAGLRTFRGIDTRLKAAEISAELAEERAAERISERQRAYIQELRSTVKELESLEENRRNQDEEIPRPLPAVVHAEPALPVPELVRKEDEVLTSPVVRDKLSLAENYLKARHYYKALEIAKELDELKPDFPGSEYIRFQVNKDMGFSDMAARSAEKIIRTAPGDSRTKSQYLFLIDYYLGGGRRERAQEIFRQALRNWPRDEAFKEKLEVTLGAKSSFLTDPADGFAHGASLQS